MRESYACVELTHGLGGGSKNLNGGERLAAFKKFVWVQLTQRSKNLSEAFVLEHAAAAVEGVYPTRYPLPGLTRLDTLPRTVSTRLDRGAIA
jgi:hypothetical protein